MNVKKWIKARFKAKVRPNWHRSRCSRYLGQEAASRQWDAVIINSYFFLGGRCRRHPMEATGYNQHPPPPSFPFVQSGRRDSLEHVCSTVGWLIASSFSSLARHFPLPVFSYCLHCRTHFNIGMQVYQVADRSHADPLNTKLLMKPFTVDHINS